MRNLIKRLLGLFLVLLILGSINQPSFAMSSLSELKIPDDQLAAVTTRFTALTTTLNPLIERTTFAQEEFLRLRAESKGSDPEFLAAQNFFRSQIKALYKSFSAESTIKLQSAQIFRKILKSPQMVTEFVATRPTVYLPPECPPAVALDGESIWETGTVVKVEDGDTVDVKTCRGTLNVRQIGIQAPETVKSTHFAQCGGVEASNLMKALLPIGTEVQLRSNNFASANNYEALARPYRYIFAKDAQGNVQQGDVLMSGTQGTLVYASSRLVATVGVDDMVIVETADAVLVAHRDRSQEVKAIVQNLSEQKRFEQTLHRKVHRPWGWYDSVDEGERFKVKRICVNPGGILSLQKHHKRAEHWIVVKGEAEVTCDDQVKRLQENESTYIPLGSVHRLSNPGNTPLELIEVQTGAYLGEDDIVRYEDTYGRPTED